jgi:hypothetical protein
MYSRYEIRFTGKEIKNRLTRRNEQQKFTFELATNY